VIRSERVGNCVNLYIFYAVTLSNILLKTT